jgi:hypothetical protein
LSTRETVLIATSARSATTRIVGLAPGGRRRADGRLRAVVMLEVVSLGAMSLVAASDRDASGLAGMTLS